MNSSPDDSPSETGEALEQRNSSSPPKTPPQSAVLPHPVHYPSSSQLMAPPSYPYPDPYFRPMLPPFDAQTFQHPTYPLPPMVQLQFMGVNQNASAPLPLETVEEPVFVNAKQYHGILRRRQARAKAELENRVVKSRKPYLHESRHLHALRRARGCGGRFANSKKGDAEEKDVGTGE